MPSFWMLVNGERRAGVSTMEIRGARARFSSNSNRVYQVANRIFNPNLLYDMRDGSIAHTTG